MRTYYSYPAIESAYETIQDEGVSLPQQTILDFQGAGVTVADGGTKTIVTIPGGGGGGTVTSVATAGLISGGPITTTGTITTDMNTNKLVGRSTAGTGIMEEITIGSGLTLTGTGTLNNTATPTPLGYYGAFQDITDQFAAVINTGYPMLLGVTDLTNGVTIVSGSRVTIANTGIYNIQWSAQFRNPDSQIHDVTIWLRKNGVDVPGSSGIVAVPAKHGAFDGHILPSWNFLIDPIAGDYYEFVWSTVDTSVFISFEPAGSPPPSTASVVLTVTQQSGIMAGAGITALNGLTGAVQTFVDDTNVTVVSSGTTHTLTWAGTLADSRVAGATKWNTKDKSATFDGQGGVISVNSRASFNINFTGTVTGWQLFETSNTPISSTCVLDVWKDTYANYPPTVADTIFGTKPSLTGAIKNEATGLSIAVTSGDTFIVNIDSNTNAVKLLLVLQFNLS